MWDEETWAEGGQARGVFCEGFYYVCGVFLWCLFPFFIRVFVLCFAFGMLFLMGFYRVVERFLCFLVAFLFWVFLKMFFLLFFCGVKHGV